MDTGFFLFCLFVFFFTLSAIIYCFLSTCLGLHIRRADLLSAFSTSAAPARRPRARAQAGEYELDSLSGAGGVGGVGGARAEDGWVGDAEYDMMRRGGPGRGFF